MVKRHHPPVICDECGEVIKGGHLKRHKEKHKNERKKILLLTCKDCERVFAKKCSLARHRDSGACKSVATFQPQL